MNWFGNGEFKYQQCSKYVLSYNIKMKKHFGTLLGKMVQIISLIISENGQSLFALAIPFNLTTSVCSESESKRRTSVSSQLIVVFEKYSRTSFGY